MSLSRPWRTKDLCDLFESFRLGYLPCPYRRFTNHGISDDPWHKIVKLDVNWPYQNEPQPPEPMNFKVEEGIPIPSKWHTVPAWAEPLLKLEPTQSLFIECTKEAKANTMSRAGNYISKHRKEWEFCCRAVYAEAGNGRDVIGVRIWRVS